MSAKQPKCPFYGKPCIEHDCTMWGHLEMINPQSGAVEDKWECSIKLIPLLLIETARKTGGVQSAVEGARNDICSRQDTFNQLAIEASNQRKQLT